MMVQKNPRIARTGAAVVTGLLLTVAALPAQTNVVMLWPNGAPGSENWTQKEAEYPVGNTGLKAVRNVVTPSIAVYLPRHQVLFAGDAAARGPNGRVISVFNADRAEEIGRAHV